MRWMCGWMTSKEGNGAVYNLPRGETTADGERKKCLVSMHRRQVGAA